MLRSILQVPQDIMDFTNKPKAHEIKIMQDLCAILKPFEVATNTSQGQNNYCLHSLEATRSSFK